MTAINLDTAYNTSDDVVARDIEGEIIIVPLISGIGDLQDDLFSLNETGREIWQRLDGTRTVRQIIAELAAAYATPAGDIEPTILAFLQELANRKMLVAQA